MSTYAYGMRFDDDSNAITVIDEENQTATTTGYINGESVEFSGGGGSSDFSTAEVTITTGSGKANTIILPVVFDGEYSAVGAIFNSVGTQTYTVPLYKGECDATLVRLEEENISVTGDIEYDQEDGVFIITGDGTITIS